MDLHPGVVGGEVLYRSSPHLHQEGQLLACVGPQLRDFLRDGLDGRTAAAKRDVALAEIRLAHANAVASRKARLRHLNVPKVMISALTARLIAQAKVANEDADAIAYETRRRLDRHLAHLILKYHATIEMELQMLERKVFEDIKLLDDMVRQARESQGLRTFALHLEHETDRRVVLRRLDTDNPQYQRCQRAAAENVKPGYFTSEGYYSGIQVLDVFKVENKALLKVFQHSTVNSEGKVKGLFCTVPQAALERVITCGLGGATFAADGTVAHEYHGLDPQDVFGATWYCTTPPPPPRSGETTGATATTGIARKIVDTSSILRCPAIFSRYSTLDQSRAFALHG
jgi:hypothetical protein